MPNALSIYKLFLKFYPKQYRERYSEQMVQTLEDLLENEADSSGRFVVWLRASSELPFSIAHENITNIGENPVNKLAFTSNKRLVTFISIFVIVLVALLFHSFVRVRTQVVPNLVKLTYGYSINTTVKNQESMTANPIERLYKSEGLHNSGCYTAVSQNIKVEVDCQAGVTAYTKLYQGDKGRNAVLGNVQKIESSLKSQGYKPGDNGVTLTSLISGTYLGKDYSPDADYIKNFGAYSCTFDTNIAYSNPKQPAINSQFYCIRRFDIFGTPNNQLKIIYLNANNNSPVFSN